MVYLESANSSEQQAAAAALYITGLITTNVGVILWISGGVKAANNRMAMQKIGYNYKANLALGATNNGVGLTLKFN